PSAPFGDGAVKRGPGRRCKAGVAIAGRGSVHGGRFLFEKGGCAADPVAPSARNVEIPARGRAWAEAQKGWQERPPGLALLSVRKYAQTINGPCLAETL